MTGLPYEDYVRLALYVLQGLIIMLMVKLTITRGQWRKPWRGDVPLYVGVLLLLVISARSRARAFGSGPFPEGWPTLVVFVATVLIAVWLVTQLEVIPRWVRARRARRRAIKRGGGGT